LVYFECYRLLDYIAGEYESDESVIKPNVYNKPAPTPTVKPPELKAPIPSYNVVTPTPPTTSTPPIGFEGCKYQPKKQTTPAPSCPALPSEIKEGNKEVFNVSNNLYTYDDAQAICKAYGARLANYDEIEEAYEAGAEWCNYGWSEGQMAYFPTQKDTWEALQKDPKTKHNCGRPGINGGFISNPHIKFGVNCYGVKPPPNEIEKNIMEANKLKPPGCPAAPPADPNVEKWKQQLDKIMINSYNQGDWSQFS